MLRHPPVWFAIQGPLLVWCAGREWWWPALALAFTIGGNVGIALTHAYYRRKGIYL